MYNKNYNGNNSKNKNNKHGNYDKHRSYNGKPNREEHHATPSIFKNLNKVDDHRSTTNKPNGNRKPYNKNFNKKQSKPAFSGFSNRIKFKHVDPNFYTEKALYDYLCNTSNELYPVVTPEIIREFRSRLFDNYHLYQIRVSNENHFNSGYTFIHIGWMAAAKEPTTEAVNISVWFTKDTLDKVPEKNKHLLYFRAIDLATSMFSAIGKYCRICIDSATYAEEKPYLKAWRADNKPNQFNDIFGKTTVSDKEHVILINQTIGKTIKIGVSLDIHFMNTISNVYGLEAKIIPFIGVALYYPSNNPKIKYDSNNLIATINKCDKNGEITYACKSEDIAIVEQIIKAGIDYEISRHHKVYSTPSKIIHSCNEPSFPKNTNK